MEKAWSWLIRLSRIKFGINDTAFAKASRPMTQGLSIGRPVGSVNETRVERLASLSSSSRSSPERNAASMRNALQRESYVR